MICYSLVCTNRQLKEAYKGEVDDFDPDFGALVLVKLMTDITQICRYQGDSIHEGIMRTSLGTDDWLTEVRLLLTGLLIEEHGSHMFG